MSSTNNDNLLKRMGRPPLWPDPTTDISRRLQEILPKEGKVKIGEKFFDNMSENGVESILSGKTEPPPSALLRIAQDIGCDLNWLAWGKEKSPPATADGRNEGNEKIAGVIFRVQEALSVFGQHLTAGKSATSFPGLQGLRDSVRSLQERLASLLRTDETKDRHDYTA